MGGRRAERSRRGRALPGGRRRAAPAGGSRAARRRPRRSRRALGWLVALVVLAAAMFALPGLLPQRTPAPPDDSPAASGRATTSSMPSPTAPADLSALPIAREPFCERLDERYVEEALEGQVTARTSYRPGDRASLAPGVSDVAHEFGCVFRSGDAEARVWVFAAPVEGDEAGAMVGEIRAERGCRYPEDALQYGTPDVVGVCALDGERVQVTARGLYGDAWLACQLTVEDSADGALARAERWCLHVATTLGARP